jgi:hypothetical protein
MRKTPRRIQRSHSSNVAKICVDDIDHGLKNDAKSYSIN